VRVRDNIAAAFNEEFDKALTEDVRRSGLSISSWFKGGVTNPETMVDQWRALGPKAVKNFIDWWDVGGYKVWITPDGKPAIELELEVPFGRVPVKMVIDLVAVKNNELLVIDTKSGAKVPESMQQVALYACGMEKAYGVRPAKGSFFMARGAGYKKDIFLTEPRSLADWQYSSEFFTQQFEAMEASIAAGGHQLARVGKHCERCDVAAGCSAVGGWLAPRYDRVAG